MIIYSSRFSKMLTFLYIGKASDVKWLVRERGEGVVGKEPICVRRIVVTAD